MTTEKKWSQMTPLELLDEAQRRMAAFEENPRKDDRSLYRGYAIDRDCATLLLQAAQVQSVEFLMWTLENRIGPMIANRP